MNSKQRRTLMRKGPSLQAYKFAVDEFLRCKDGYLPIKEAFPRWIALKPDYYVDILSTPPFEGAYYSIDTLGLNQLLELEIERRFEKRFLND